LTIPGDWRTLGAGVCGRAGEATSRSPISSRKRNDQGR